MTLAVDLGRLFASARRGIGWSQHELARRAGISQTAISRFERGRPCGLSLDDIARLAAALGGNVRVTFDAPFLADRARQRERLHARCQASVARHLHDDEWIAETEVEIEGGAGPGWIDVIAFHRASGTLLIIEIKTEIHDLGRIVRTLDWYERCVVTVARRRGWVVRSTYPCLLVLSTVVAESALHDNRDFIAETFPGRARSLRELVKDPIRATALPRRSIAVIDPLSRRREWLRPTPMDGRRSPPAHVDYAAAARRLAGRG